MIEPVDGGITAASGYRAAGVACGIKTSGLDLALIVSDTRASAAGLFTTNLAKAAPVLVSQQHLERTGGVAAAVVVNSGCANACTGAAGLEVARSMAAETARVTGRSVEEVLVASTGVIGVALDLARVKRGISLAAAALDRTGHESAARAIMTTDRFPKAYAVRVKTPAGTFSVGGIAKGAGMIEPRLATMLAFLTTDAQIEPATLRTALTDAVSETFNAITVDGDTSTNDSVFVLANGASGVKIESSVLAEFTSGLRTVCRELALGIVRSGEGATKLIAVRVTGAACEEHAHQAARVIANSLLVKTAMHGGDPNWGRLVAAAGRAEVPFTLEKASVRIGPHTLFAGGRPFDERAADAAAYLKGSEIDVEVDLGAGGSAEATVWTCDLSAEYVKINGEYRT